MGLTAALRSDAPVVDCGLPSDSRRPAHCAAVNAIAFQRNISPGAGDHAWRVICRLCRLVCCCSLGLSSRSRGSLGLSSRSRGICLRLSSRHRRRFLGSDILNLLLLRQLLRT
jgi:hypothetical protein